MVEWIFYPARFAKRAVNLAKIEYVSERYSADIGKGYIYVDAEQVLQTGKSS